ncbi:MAG: insulinase family protein [Oscillospiraceae bacterium]|nr:insulinase family protein [Oscillospiraceae bacterium]
MTEKIYPGLGERVWQQTLPNGLTVAVVPRPGFSRKLAYFVTDMGAIHTDFLLEGERHQVPAGIAHYLEHKLFDLPNRDVSAELAELGANVNAFTSYDMTAYYFSCTEHFEQSLRLLLEFVSTPYFTQESVERERGIIDQEIGMNLDAPDSVIFEKLMEGMYRNHRIRVPILGTSESIREITPELLELCHRAFYSPANMILCVVGDVDPEAVAQIALEITGEEKRPVAEKLPPEPEDLTVPIPYQERQMEVAMPTFQLGFKCQSVDKGEAAIRQEIIGDLAAEALFGESSELYLRLYEEGLIDQSFGGGYETVDGCAMVNCGGDSHDPEAVWDAIVAQAKLLAERGIEEPAFLRMKRSAMGRRIRDLDVFDSVCFRICAYHFAGFDYFDFPAVYESVTAEEIQTFLRESVIATHSSLSVIRPIKKEE